MVTRYLLFKTDWADYMTPWLTATLATDLCAMNTFLCVLLTSHGKGLTLTLLPRLKLQTHSCVLQLTHD